MLRKLSESSGGREFRISNLWTEPATAMITAQVAMAAPRVWQTGQMCESTGLESRSKQHSKQCSCAPKKMAASSRARTQNRLELVGNLVPNFSDSEELNGTPDAIVRHNDNGQARRITPSGLH
jgi:hypothetical protein